MPVRALRRVALGAQCAVDAGPKPINARKGIKTLGIAVLVLVAGVLALIVYMWEERDE